MCIPGLLFHCRLGLGTSSLCCRGCTIDLGKVSSCYETAPCLFCCLISCRHRKIADDSFSTTSLHETMVKHRIKTRKIFGQCVNLFAFVLFFSDMSVQNKSNLSPVPLIAMLLSTMTFTGPKLSNYR
ncbi:hypothetical protein EDD18DRAFT_173094 [Armillaria luteobubalina]|uniref:Uncharacterized protein n=1 Tax=Armillaria luteobubalina TaxID=153913 RepID=A0AA39UNK2_9AGAR|nr:hypothetical protein EDD18DRAFT_173094 [Armillaria luteobubalina]